MAPMSTKRKIAAIAQSCRTSVPMRRSAVWLDPDVWLDPRARGSLLHDVFDGSLRAAKASGVKLDDTAFESIFVAPQTAQLFWLQAFRQFSEIADRFTGACGRQRCHANDDSIEWSMKHVPFSAEQCCVSRQWLIFFDDVARLYVEL